MFKAYKHFFKKHILHTAGFSLFVVFCMVGAILAPSAANRSYAAAGDVGHEGPSTLGSTTPTTTGTTAEKPESKLWFTQDKIWWAWLWDATLLRYDIAKLDPATHTWTFQGLNLGEARPASRADTLYDATSNSLYVASHIYVQPKLGDPPIRDAAKFFRLTYSPMTQDWALSANYPVSLEPNATEALTIARDKTGRIWAAWTESQQLKLAWTTSSPKIWSSPISLPVPQAQNLNVDDIASITAFDKGNQIGVIWSNQTSTTLSSSVYFSSIFASNDPLKTESWNTTDAFGPGELAADDHLNIKALDSDSSGRVYAVVKTSADDKVENGVFTADPESPSVVLLKRDTSGTWTPTTVAQVKDCVTRPSLLINDNMNKAHVYMTSPQNGCPIGASGRAGSIFEKKLSLDAPTFTAGKGTMIMHDEDSQNLNDVSTTKQEITAKSGIVVLASNNVTKRYWHSETNVPSLPPTSTTTTTTTSTTTTTTVPSGQPVSTQSGDGYWLLGADGGVFSYGKAQFHGSMGGKPLNKPIVDMAAAPDGKGYWLVASDGGIFAFGSATFFGSMGGKPLNKPIVSIVATKDGLGYWLVASDGGIFSFGNATYRGSMGGKPLNKPIVDMAAANDGYWLVASDGGIFSFETTFYGSTGSMALNKPVVSMLSTNAADGYWLVASDGGTFAFGNAGYFGSSASAASKVIVDVLATPNGDGYWLVASDGSMLPYGKAGYFGSAGSLKLNMPIVSAAR